MNLQNGGGGGGENWRETGQPERESCRHSDKRLCVEVVRACALCTAPESGYERVGSPDFLSLRTERCDNNR